jgi:ribonuclease Y
VGKKIIADAKEAAKEAAQAAKKEAIMEAKESLQAEKAELERETRERRKELQKLETRIVQKEENLDHKRDQIEKKERDIITIEEQLKKQEKEIAQIKVRQLRELENLSGMSSEEAKKLLLSNIQSEIRHEANKMIKEIGEEAKKTADCNARWLVSQAIQRCAADLVSESTVSMVTLPNEEMKGRIIGREGRNIRALENLTGIDLIIDDTPEAVILSGYDPIKRQVAKIALERLIVDGRIHPSRIEEVVAKAEKDMEESLRQEGERCTFDLGIHGIPTDSLYLLGRLKYRTSYGQNVLKHSMEVAHLAGVMAAELGIDVKMVKRAGLLHDLGKAIDSTVEGSHAAIGADLARKSGENQEIVHAIAAHHAEEEPKTVMAILVQAADAISAARPGARKESLESYVKRLEKLEAIASSFPGVERTFAIQAGREVRIIVSSDEVNDAEIVALSREIAQKVEDELEYPGMVKINVIRETRAVEYAK